MSTAEQLAPVIPLRPTDLAPSPPGPPSPPPPSDPPEVEQPTAEPEQPTGALAKWQSSNLPTLEAIGHRLRWWARAVWHYGKWHALNAWWTIPRELWYPVRGGLVDAYKAWRAWQKCVEDYALIKDPNVPTNGKAVDDTGSRKTRHAAYSAIVGIVYLAATVVLMITLGSFQTGGLIALLVPLLIADAIGRRTRAEDLVTIPPPMICSLSDPDVPPAKHEAGILALLEGFGFDDATIVERLKHDPVALRWTITLDSGHKIEQAHIEAIGRLLDVPDDGIQALRTGHSRQTQLVIDTGDPLINLPVRVLPEPGSRSISQPLGLGVDRNLARWWLSTSAIHMDVIATTGAGKSELLQALLIEWAACRDVFPVFVDLSEGWLGPLNEAILRKTAYTEAELYVLVEWLEGQLDLRKRKLRTAGGLCKEWRLEWGPEIKVVIDEYALVAALRAPEPKALTLHDRIESVMRQARKYKITFIRAMHKAGVKDAGSSLSSSLTAVQILGACGMADVVSVWDADLRDQGWRPDRFVQATETVGADGGTQLEMNDAGKFFCRGPGNLEPIAKRIDTPPPAAEVKAWTERVAAAGLPPLWTDQRDAGINPLWLSVEDAFNQLGDQLDGARVVGWLVDNGWPDMTLVELGRQVPRTKDEQRAGPNQQRVWRRSTIDRLLREVR